MRHEVHVLAWCCAGAPFCPSILTEYVLLVNDTRINGNWTGQGGGRGGMVQISLVSNHPQQAIGLFSLL